MIFFLFYFYFFFKIFLRKKNRFVTIKNFWIFGGGRSMYVFLWEFCCVLENLFFIMVQ